MNVPRIVTFQSFVGGLIFNAGSRFGDSRDANEMSVKPFLLRYSWESHFTLGNVLRFDSRTILILARFLMMDGHVS